jgi:hypothetical protein
MNVRAAAVLCLRVVLAAATLFACFVVAVGVAGPRDLPELAPEEAGAGAGALVVVSLLNAAVLAYLVVRSRWSGWRLVAAVFLALFGTVTVLPQMETAVFLTGLPAGTVLRLVLMGFLAAAAAAPLVVLIFGKIRSRPATAARRPQHDLGGNEWAWKLALIAAAYIALYFTFGYFVAWQSPAVRAYYGGVDPGSFKMAMANVVRDTPWLPPFQALRAVLWAGIALPVIRMMRGPRWEAGLAVALLFAVLANAQLLLPNPLMPEEVRMAHLAETASSNFIFGWLVAWLLGRHHSSPRDLLPRRDSAVPV